MSKIKSVLTYILAVLIILQCYSLLSMILPNAVFYVGIIVLMLLLLGMERKIIIPQNLKLLFLIYALEMPLLMLNKYFRNFEFLVSVYGTFLIALIYFYDRDRRDRLFEAYTNVVFFICGVSLFFFVFGSLLNVIVPTNYYPYTIVGWGKNDYYDYFHMYCEGQKAYALGYAGVRNIALFLEGPMLTYVVGFSLFFELFIRKKCRKSVVIIQVITIITSFSTTGILSVFILLYLKSYQLLKKNKIVKYIFIPFAILLVMFASYYVIVDKLISNVYSSSARIDDIVATFKAFFTNPINGLGYNNIDALSPFRDYKRGRNGLSTGVGGILSYGGVIWGIWYIIPLIYAVIKYTQSNRRVFYNFIIFAFALLFVTVVQSRSLCTIVNAINWIYVLDKSKK